MNNKYYSLLPILITQFSDNLNNSDNNNNENNDNDNNYLISRILNNLTQHDELLLSLYYTVGRENWLKFINTLKNDNDNNNNNSYIINIGNSISNLVTMESICSDMNREQKLLPIILADWCLSKDIRKQEIASKIIFNIGLHSENNLSGHIKLLENIINKWINSDNFVLQSNAIRIQASIASLQLKRREVKYADGIYLLYPNKTNKDAMITITNNTKTAAVDIIFIHGVTGHPIQTWRNLQQEDTNPSTVLSTDIILPNIMPDLNLTWPLSTRDDDEIKDNSKNEINNDNDIKKDKQTIDINSNDISESICWPRDWLPKDIPDSRIISVGYDIFLSKWFGEALPIQQQSLEIIKKLKVFYFILF